MKRKKRRAKKEKEWTVKEFVDDVWGTMEEQANKNKDLGMLHARLQPEWNQIIGKITMLLDAEAKSDVTKYIEEVCKYKDRAVRPLIETLLRFKSFIKGPMKDGK